MTYQLKTISAFWEERVAGLSSDGTFNESLEVLQNWPAWFFLSLNDIRTKYRRAKLGPWWVVLGMAIALAAMAMVWSVIFHLDWRHYLTYIITGIIIWNWISAYITQAPDIFANDFGNLLRSLPTSPLVHTLRFVMRGFWLFLHYLPIWLVAALVSGVWPTFFSLLLFPLGVVAVLLNACSITIIVGMAGARFRDLSPAITAVMTPMMMLTPVMWHTSMLGSYSFVALLNPFTHFLAVVRGPLIGQIPSLLSVAVVVICTTLNLAFAAWCYQRYRRVLVLWT